MSDAIEVKDDKDTSIKVLDNDSSSGPGLDESSLAVISAPAYATSHRVHDDHLHYRSYKGFVGTDTLRYQVCDNAGACKSATVTISVVG